MFRMLWRFSICISAPPNKFHLQFWLCWMALRPNLSSSIESVSGRQNTFKFTELINHRLQYPLFMPQICDITPGLALLSLGPLHCPDPWQYHKRTGDTAGGSSWNVLEHLIQDDPNQLVDPYLCPWLRTLLAGGSQTEGVWRRSRRWRLCLSRSLTRMLLPEAGFLMLSTGLQWARACSSTHCTRFSSAFETGSSPSPETDKRCVSFGLEMSFCLTVWLTQYMIQKYSY